MKDLLKIIGIFAIFVVVIPMLGFWAGNSNTVEQASEQTDIAYSETQPVIETLPTETAATTDEKIAPAQEEFKVLDFTSGQVMTMTMYDYVVGAVLGEMPATFGEEALKAQAVAAHTYAVRRKEQQLENPDSELMGAYISNDSTKYQAYFTPDQAKAFYGSGYNEYNKKVCSAVDCVINEIIVYNNEPIVAAFHSTSPGKTESAEVIWGSQVDYLVPVDSSDDETSPSFIEEKTFTSDEISSKLTDSEYGIKLSYDKSQWIKIISTSSSGTVTEVSAGDKILNGTELRSLLSLKSACFEVEYKDDTFTFTTKGSGHGVGLSQYGANALAASGSTYKEILLHYYKGVEIIDLQEQ